MINRRDFIKNSALGFLAVNTLGLFPEKVFAADKLSVKTRYGTFNGFTDKSGVKTWLGIPFAKPPVKKLRSCHAVDLPFTFNVEDHIVPNPNQKLVKQVQASWAAFAATDNPDNEFIPHWEKYSANNRQTMELNSSGCVLHKDLNTENLNALRYVYES